MKSITKPIPVADKPHIVIMRRRVRIRKDTTDVERTLAFVFAEGKVSRAGDYYMVEFLERKVCFTLSGVFVSSDATDNSNPLVSHRFRVILDERIAELYNLL